MKGKTKPHFDLPPKARHHSSPIKVQIIMGKHYSIEFKNHIVNLAQREK
ncbi:hypothetical protein CF65_02419 [Aggregatibacter actinomycetemcomitans HK1651]|nr:hypothetical protein ANH9381_1907 [Aggregatibacter actinomycetemcomitans ANH9381]AHN72545.1 hypothetical protein CF65_02419 [Aggregatibacter actinomycetemcomitans HK1651]